MADPHDPLVGDREGTASVDDVDAQSGERFDDLFRALSDPRRNLVVTYLREEERATLDELAAHVAAQEAAAREGAETSENTASEDAVRGRSADEDAATDTSTNDRTEATERVKYALYHVHLPHLVDAGVLRYGDDRKTVERGAAFDATVTILG